MQIEIDLTNRTSRKVDRSFLRKIVRKTLGLSELRFAAVKLSLVLVKKAEIKGLNRIWRGKNQATDVLSFNYSSGYNKKKALGTNRLEGEVILAPEMIAESAKASGLRFQEELAFVLSHGILHLSGLRHGKKMYAIQDQVIASNKK